MKSLHYGFVGLIAAIIIGLIVLGGAGYAIYKNENHSQISSSEQVDISDWKTVVNSQYGFEFKYPEDKVSVSTNYFDRDINGRGPVNSAQYLNFDIKSGGNFNFMLIENSDKMTPVFSNELEEVKFKINLGYNPKYSQIKINGYTGYKIEEYLKGYNDPKECLYDKIVTKKGNYWYEFYTRVCDGNVNESLKTFESIASTFKFTN